MCGLPRQPRRPGSCRFRVWRFILGQYLASLEVDQRQRLILQADKLQEMLGASRLIEQTVEAARRLLATRKDIKLVTPVSGVLRFQATNLQELGEFLWGLRLEIVEKLHLPSTFTIDRKSVV